MGMTATDGVSVQNRALEAPSRPSQPQATAPEAKKPTMARPKRLWEGSPERWEQQPKKPIEEWRGQEPTWISDLKPETKVGAILGTSFVATLGLGIAGLVTGSLGLLVAAPLAGVAGLYYGIWKPLNL